MGNVVLWLIHHPARFNAETIWRTWPAHEHHKLSCQHPTQIQLIFNSTSETTNNQQQTEKNQQRADTKQKDWPALGEVKTGMAAEGGPEDEAPADSPEEEEAFWVEPAFTHFSPIT